jgi:hypothetical protein
MTPETNDPDDVFASVPPAADSFSLVEVACRRHDECDRQRSQAPLNDVLHAYARTRALDASNWPGVPRRDLRTFAANCGERLRADPQGLARRMADLTRVQRERLRPLHSGSPGAAHLAQLARCTAAT